VPYHRLPVGLPLQASILAGGQLIGDDMLVVPVRFVRRDCGTMNAVYLFRFAAGRIVSLTEYGSIEDAVRGARLSA
jgi:hypothetical protein